MIPNSSSNGLRLKQIVARCIVGAVLLGALGFVGMVVWHVPWALAVYGGLGLFAWALYNI